LPSSNNIILDGMVCVSVTSKGEKAFLNVKKIIYHMKLGMTPFTRSLIQETIYTKKKTNRVKRQYSYMDYFYTFVDFLL
jgi:hypothetical protein